MSDTCKVCGKEKTRDGCPDRIEHANSIAWQGFFPDMRGAPSRPGGPGPDTLQGKDTEGQASTPDTEKRGTEPMSPSTETP